MSYAGLSSLSAVSHLEPKNNPTGEGCIHCPYFTEWTKLHAQGHPASIWQYQISNSSLSNSDIYVLKQVFPNLNMHPSNLEDLLENKLLAPPEFDSVVLW